MQTLHEKLKQTLTEKLQPEVFELGGVLNQF